MFESLDTLILEELLVCGSYIESKITKKKKKKIFLLIKDIKLRNVWN